MKKVTGNNYVIYNADCRAVLKKLAKQGKQIDVVIVDPPYALSSLKKRFSKNTSAPAKFGRDGAFSRLSRGFLGREWDDEIAFDPELWKLALQVLKPGGFLFSFAIPRKYHLMAAAAEMAGFIVVDQMPWLYGSAIAKSHDVHKHMLRLDERAAKKWKGWRTPSLSPGQESVMLAQKPMSETTVARNVLKHGVGAFNIDAIKTRGSGRYPKNVMHDGSAQVIEEFSKYGTTKSKRSHRGEVNSNGHGGILDGKSRKNGGNTVRGFDDEGTVARFFYSAKVGKNEANEGLDGITNNHPTKKPITLLIQYILLACPPGGTVLDFFMGSGSTGCAAVANGFKFIGVEKEVDYFAISRQRIKHWSAKYQPVVKTVKSKKLLAA